MSKQYAGNANDALTIEVSGTGAAVLIDGDTLLIIVNRRGVPVRAHRITIAAIETTDDPAAIGAIQRELWQRVGPPEGARWPDHHVGQM